MKVHLCHTTAENGKLLVPRCRSETAVRFFFAGRSLSQVEFIIPNKSSLARDATRHMINERAWHTEEK